MMDTACIVAAHGADLLPQSMGAYWMPCFMALSFHSWPQNKHLLAWLVLRSQIQDSGQSEQWIFHGHGWPSARYVNLGLKFQHGRWLTLCWHFLQHWGLIARWGLAFFQALVPHGFTEGCCFQGCYGTKVLLDLVCST